jgi:hypothetical protein
MMPGDADSPHADELAQAPADPASGRDSSGVVVGSKSEPPGSADDETRAIMSEVPPLALLAAISALVALILQRLILPLMAAQKLSLPYALVLIAPFVRNVAALSALVALVSGMWDVVRSSLTHTSRRVLLAGLSGLLVSTLSLATLTPAGYLMPSHVLVATGALHTLVVQLAMITMRARRSLAGRTTVALIAAASIFPLSALLIRHADMGFLKFLSAASEGVPGLYGLGEIAYLLVPIAAAFVVLPWDDAPMARAARRAGAVAVGVTALLFAAGARMPHEVYGHVLYATLRLEWALEKASLGYAVPVSLAAGAAMAATVSRDSRHQQGGAGLWLWLAGGFNPLTPARLLMTCLGALLICRAVLSLLDGTERESTV